MQITWFTLFAFITVIIAYTVAIFVFSFNQKADPVVTSNLLILNIIGAVSFVFFMALYIYHKVEGKKGGVIGGIALSISIIVFALDGVFGWNALQNKTPIVYGMFVSICTIATLFLIGLMVYYLGSGMSKKKGAGNDPFSRLEELEAKHLSEQAEDRIKELTSERTQYKLDKQRKITERSIQMKNKSKNKKKRK